MGTQTLAVAVNLLGGFVVSSLLCATKSPSTQYMRVADMRRSRQHSETRVLWQT